MKRLLFITLFLYLSNFILAQLPNLTKVEYYIDTDPGYGLATNVSVSASANLDITFNPDVSALSDGIHMLFVRAKDANDKWSLAKSQSFYKGFGVLNQTITKAEYYFDSDPGYGKATSISINPATDIDVTIKLDVSTLENGIHKLFIRAQDNAGQWTTTKSHTFYKGIFSTGKAANIKTVEYYFDTDPGLGSGNKVSFTSGTELDLTFDADLSGLTGEFHKIFIRAQDENGSWSLIHEYSFRIFPTSVQELDISGILIFPNPSNGDFNLQIESKNKKTGIEILNPNGQVVFKKLYFSENISDNISLDQAKGAYLIKIINNGKISIRKLIIE
jgi:hypothetical protein